MISIDLRVKKYAKSIWASAFLCSLALFVVATAVSELGLFVLEGFGDVLFGLLGFWGRSAGCVGEAFRLQARELFGGENFEFFQEVLFFRCDEGSDASLGFPHGIQTVEVVGGDFVEIKLENMADTVEIADTGDSLGCDEGSEPALFEIPKRAVAEFGLFGPVKGLERKSGLAERRGDGVKGFFSA